VIVLDIAREILMSLTKTKRKSRSEQNKTLSRNAEKIVNNFKDLEKTVKETRVGYFRLKKILEQESNLYKNQNTAAMRVLVEALEAYDGLRSYAIDKELEEVDKMLKRTSAPMRAELRGWVKEFMLEEPIETNPTLIEGVKQSEIKEAIESPAPDEPEAQDLLAPVSLMVLGIGGRDNENKNSKTTLESTSGHSIRQVKPPFDQTTGYPRHDFEQYKPLKRERPSRDPVDLTLNPYESHYSGLRHEASGSEPDTVTKFVLESEQSLKALERKRDLFDYGEVVTD
jgi:hypothetical protein